MFWIFGLVGAGLLVTGVVKYHRPIRDAAQLTIHTQPTLPGPFGPE